jgi:hypothetical protein
MACYVLLHEINELLQIIQPSRPYQPVNHNERSYRSRPVQIDLPEFTASVPVPQEGMGIEKGNGR